MTHKVVIHSELQAARRVAQDILQRVEAHGYAADVCFAIRLALEEALINAVKHGNRCDRGKKITVCADVDGERTSITIVDEGPGFDPAKLADPTADENLEKPGGRGIMLIRAYMDEVAHSPRGNEIRMVKRRG